MTHFWTNYHSHSHYCDGAGTPEQQVLGAIDQGLRCFGFSSHGPLPFSTSWSMKPERLSDYLKEVQQLKEKYAGRIELYLGLEIDYIPLVNSIAQFVDRLDYTVGSVHYVDAFDDGTPWEIDATTDVFLKGLVEIHGGDIQNALKRYYGHIRTMVGHDCPDVVGHLDKIKMHNVNGSLFREEEEWYRQEVLLTLESIARAGCIVEINTRGLYKRKQAVYPSHWVIREMHEMKIPVMINSDSHSPAEITACFAETAGRLKAAGYRALRILLQGEWQDVAFDEKGLYLE